MRFLKACVFLFLAIICSISADQKMTLRSPNAETPIELSLISDPYFAKFKISPDSHISLETIADKVLDYDPETSTMKLPVYVKNGGDVNHDSQVFFQDTPQWLLIHSENFEEEPEGWSHTQLSRCGDINNNFLGGRCYFSDITLRFTLRDIPAHSMIKIKANFHFFGEWKGETAYAKINDNIIWTHSYNWCDKVLPWMCKKYGVYACGLDFPDKLAQPIEFYTRHNENEITFSFSSTLAADPCVASWGIDDFEVYIM